MLEFEKKILELEKTIGDLKLTTTNNTLNVDTEIKVLENKKTKYLSVVYEKLTPWQKVQVARHEDRPIYSDYINNLVEDYIPISGDRSFADDKALLTGIGKLNSIPCIFIGHERGYDTPSRIKHFFGMAKPEGYRKAVRLMKMGDKFNLPIVTFVDTPGAYPGKGAEERGQAEAIAKSIETSFKIHTPIVSVIIGEGGSGGAIALTTSDCVMMLEHSVYSVISPEGCASILWRDVKKNHQAAKQLHLTAQELYKFKLIDVIIQEPIGGAHRNKKKTVKVIGDALTIKIRELLNTKPNILRRNRRQKFINMGKEFY